MKKGSALLLISTLFLVASCNHNDPSLESHQNTTPSSRVEAAKVTFAKTEITVEEESQTLLAFETNRPGLVIFTSSDESVAVVSKEGVVLAKKAGDTTIKASVEEANATLTLHVIPAKGETAIVAPSILYLDTKSKQPVSIDAKLLQDGKENPSAIFTYEVADDTVASVDTNGVITPIKSGNTIITIRSDNISIDILADVYDEAIHTPKEFTTFLTTGQAKYDAKGTPNYRAYLANDLDFKDTVYEGYNTADDRVDATAFSAELNGRFHAIRNITFTQNENPQSLFGQCVGSKVYDLAFLNVTYTSEKAGGLALKAAKKWATVSTAASFENIYLEANIENQWGGLIPTFYGNDMTNVVAKLSSKDGVSYDTIRGLATNAYNWDQGILQNVIVYSSCGAITPIGHSEYINGRELDVSSLHCTESVTEAAYWGITSLDASRWNLSPTACPSLITE